VWKKAGIVASASLAAVLALAPVANASPAGKDKGDDAEQVITATTRRRTAWSTSVTSTC
jgi:hypothetical protein